MATQKQRRKRAKEKRHAYDLVEIDAEGNETVLTPTQVKSDAPPRAKPKKGETRSAPKSKLGRGSPQPPTWGRVLKRGAIFAPIFLATVLLLAGNRLTFAGAVVQTAFLLAIFIPFSYFMDSFMYRRYQRRANEPAQR